MKIVWLISNSKMYTCIQLIQIFQCDTVHQFFVCAYEKSNLQNVHTTLTNNISIRSFLFYCHLINLFLISVFVTN